MLNLLTLPIRPESELAASSQAILASRPDMDAVVLPMLMQRFPSQRREEIMVIAGIPPDELRHTRAAQEWLAEGRRDEAAAMTLRQLNRRCGPLSEPTTSQIQSLPLEQLEALADALLDFQGSADLTSGWPPTPRPFPRLSEATMERRAREQTEPDQDCP